jgi:hypothetical protein
MSRSYTSSPPQVPPWLVMGQLCFALLVLQKLAIVCQLYTVILCSLQVTVFTEYLSVIWLSNKSSFRDAFQGVPHI